MNKIALLTTAIALAASLVLLGLVIGLGYIIATSERVAETFVVGTAVVTVVGIVFACLYEPCKVLAWKVHERKRTRR